MEFLISFVLFCSSLIGMGKTASEPRHYSYFYFQEKRLEKMIALTNKVDNLEKAFAAKQKELDYQSEKLKTEKSKMESDINKLAIDISNEVRHKTQAHLKLQTQEITELMKRVESIMNTADELMTSSEAKIARLSIDVREYTNKSRESLQTLVKDSIKPKVAFLARTLSNTSPGDNRKLIFTTTLVNTNNSYSTETGEFISPVPGTYWFATQICASYQKYVNLRMYVNDILMSDSLKWDGNGSSDCVSFNTVAVLSEGDKVYVQTGQGTDVGNSTIRQFIYFQVFQASGP